MMSRLTETMAMLVRAKKIWAKAWSDLEGVRLLRLRSLYDSWVGIEDGVVLDVGMTVDVE